jgi:hypothetical protein
MVFRHASQETKFLARKEWNIMKFKTTKKEIMDNYSSIIKTGYCSIQYLLRYVEPSAYTCGSDGWNADIYLIKNVAIVTGYKPFGNIVPGYEVNKHYDDLAIAIVNERITWQEQKEQLNMLIDDYIKAACNR